MSVWRTTSHIRALKREVSLIVLMPDFSADEPKRFDTILYAAPKGFESDYIIRRTTIEVDFCKRGTTAAVCIPSSVWQSVASDEAIKEIVALLSKVYPLNFSFAQSSPDIQFLA